jgi:ribosome-interacting GTPase 1
MPANLTPQYFEAEKWFKQATTTEEKILALEKMLAVIPKHKGTDHLKADLRRKLSQLKDPETQKTARGKTVDIFHIPKTGASQIALIGLPNTGKSSIVAAITNAKVHIADFPYATTVPVPGMVYYEDIQIELVDMPPLTADYVAPGQIGTYRHCDLIAACIDLSADIAEQVKTITDFLQTRSLPIYGKKDVNAACIDSQAKKAFYLCTKSDIAQPDALETLKKLSKYLLPVIVTSTENFEGIEELPRRLFELCDIIRVYTKPPHHKVDLGEPFTMPVGSTVLDLAKVIHRELAEKFKSARLWGKGVYDGQNIPRDHVLNDKDVVELHFA